MRGKFGRRYRPHRRVGPSWVGSCVQLRPSDRTDDLDLCVDEGVRVEAACDVHLGPCVCDSLGDDLRGSCSLAGPWSARRVVLGPPNPEVRVCLLVELESYLER